MKLPTVTCLRCNHKWIPRVPEPIQCPNCGSAYWNRQYTYKIKNNNKKTLGDNLKMLPNELDNK